MQVLWARGPSTVLEIQDALKERLEDSSIRTFLSILERKKRVSRVKQGRAFVYAATGDRPTARRRAVRQLINRFFSNPAELMLTVLETEELSAGELERLRKAISAERRKP